MIIGDGIMLGAGGESASIFVTGLSETDTVTANKDGKTVIGKWTQIPNPVSHGLPDGYTELEYIESTGTQYINSNRYVVANDVVKIKMNFTSVISDDHYFGCSDVSSSGRARFGNYAGKWIYQVGENILNSGIPLANVDYNVVMNMGSSKQTLTINDSLIGETNNSFTKSAKVAYILALYNYNGNAELMAHAKLYNLEWISGGEIVMNLVPCKRNSDGAIGMYDLVTNSFFANSGTGTFTAGVEIPSYIYGFEIAPIKSYGTWTVSNADSTKVTDVLVDAAAEFEVAL